MAFSGRVNLAFPIETMISIEKECDKLGISRTQFIKSAVHDRLKQSGDKELTTDLIKIKEDIYELKKIMMLILDK
jgi:hypothetical protein